MEAAIIWIALIIIFAVVEIITVGLTSIWFAGGAVVALLVDAAGLGPVWQFAGLCGAGSITLSGGKGRTRETKDQESGSKFIKFYGKSR